MEIINLAVSWALFGLIWIVQLVQYPAFFHVSDVNFEAFHQHHTASITIIVMPLMLIEIALVAYLTYQNNSIIYCIPLLLVILIWLSTFLIQVPIHHQLGEGKEVAIIKKLVQTNWIRTILWTFKALWVSYYFTKFS